MPSTSGRLLKNLASFVFATLRSSTDEKSVLRLFAAAALPDKFIKQPAAFYR